MRSDTGTYVVVYACDVNARLQVGRWSEIELQPGYYLYVGSAFGPGGVRARVQRHCRKEKKLHWHIDYLSAQLSPLEAWLCYQDERLEHRWAQALSEMKAMSPVEGFGCTDCDCRSHLFTTQERPDIEEFSKLARGEIVRCEF